jgi:hypothetical protein
VAAFFRRIEVGAGGAKLIFHLEVVIVFELIKLGDQTAGFQMQFGLPIQFSGRHLRIQAEPCIAGINQTPLDAVRDGLLGGKRRKRRAGGFGLRVKDGRTSQQHRARAGKAGDETSWHEP